MLSHSHPVIIFLVVTAILNSGCQFQEKPVYESIKLTESNDPFFISSECDSVFYITLKTEPNNPIAQVDKLELLNSKIYVLDKEILETLFIFDSSGNFLNKLETRPGGPGEFTSLDDFAVDENYIYILNNESQKVFKYSKNGDFLQDIKIHTFAHSIEVFDNSIFIYRNNEYNPFDSFQNNQVIRVGQNGKVLDQYLPLTRENNYLSFHESFRPFHKSSNSLIFSQALNDTIYSFKQSQFIPFKIIDFEKKALTQNPEILKSIQLFSDSPKRYQSQYLMGSSYIHQGSVFSIFFAGDRYNYIFDANRSSNPQAYTFIKDDLMEYPFFHIDYMDKNVLATTIPFELLKSYSSSLESHRVQKALNDANNNNQNPLVFIYKFKQHSD